MKKHIWVGVKRADANFVYVGVPGLTDAACLVDAAGARFTNKFGQYAWVNLFGCKIVLLGILWFGPPSSRVWLVPVAGLRGRETGYPMA